LVARGAGSNGIFLVYLVSSKNDERSSPDQQSGANVRETRGVPSRLWIQELMMEGRMVWHLKNLYSRREGVEDMLKEEKELTKVEALKLDMESNAVWWAQEENVLTLSAHH
jgi:hypothetical protein